MLEEPLNNTFFILISHQISSLIPTIRSRCIRYKFQNPTFEEFNTILKDYDDSIDNQLIDFLYDLSNGSPGLAIKLIYEEMYQIFEDLSLILRDQKPLSSNILNLSNNVGSYSNEQYKVFLYIIKFILTNIIKFNLGINFHHLVNKKLSESLFDISKCLNNNVCIEILKYIDNNEKNLFIFNLDKKIFSLNIFSSLGHKL